MSTQAQTASRRAILRAAASTTGLLICSPYIGAARADSIHLLDAAQRSVILPRAARRIVVAASVHLLALALIHPKPVSLLAAVPAPGGGNDEAVKQILRRKFPEIESVPTIGRENGGGLSIERLIALQPDLVLFSMGQMPPANLLSGLDRAGIPALVVDFSVNALAATPGSLRVLGKAIGSTEKAETYGSFHEERIAALQARLRSARSPSPRVLVDVHAGTAPCCFSMGRGSTADFLAFVGAENIASGVLPGLSGQLNPEYVVKQDPEIIIATGGSYSAGRGLSIGEGFGPDVAQSSLRRLAATPWIQATSAGRSGQIFGLWHPLPSMPVNIVVAELLARWLRPDAAADIDPLATLARINREFLAVPMTDTYWTGPVEAAVGREERAR